MAALALLGPVFCSWMYGSSGPGLLWMAVGLLLAVQAIHWPSGMYLTEGKDLVFQAVTVMVMASASVPLSIVLAIHLGAAGPLLSAALCVFLFQLVPCLLLVRRHLQRRARMQAAEHASGSSVY